QLLEVIHVVYDSLRSPGADHRQHELARFSNEPRSIERVFFCSWKLRRKVIKPAAIASRYLLTAAAGRSGIHEASIRVQLYTMFSYLILPCAITSISMCTIYPCRPS